MQGLAFRKTKGTPISSHSSLLPNSPQLQQLLISVSMDLPALDISHKWNHKPYGLCDWLLSPDIAFSMCIHIAACFWVLFLYTAVPPSTAQICQCLFIPSSTDGCFWPLWVMLLLTLMYKFFMWTYVFTSFGHIPKRGIARSYGISI